MNILLNSSSEDKKRLLENALDGQIPYWGIETEEIGNADTSLSLSIEEITQRAVDNAKLAKEQPNTDLGVGMEAGLEKVSGIYRLMAVAVFWDGKILLTGKSNGLPLPIALSEKVTPSVELKSLIEEHRKTAPEEEMERLDELLSHKLSFESALNKAMPQLRGRFYKSKVDVFLSTLAPPRLAPNLFKLAGVLTGIFFGLRGIIALTSPILSYMSMLREFPYREFYLQLAIFLMFAIFIWSIGLMLMGFVPKYSQSTKLRVSHWLTAFSTILLMFLVGVLFWQSNGENLLIFPWNIYIFWRGIWPTFMITTITALVGCHLYWLLQLSRSSYVSNRSRWLLLSGLIALIPTLLLIAAGGNPFVFELLQGAIGLLLSGGLWSIGRDLDKESREVEAKYPLVKKVLLDA